MSSHLDFLAGAGPLKKAAAQGGPQTPPPTPRQPAQGMDISRDAAALAKRKLDAEARAKAAKTGPVKRYKQLIPAK